MSVARMRELQSEIRRASEFTGIRKIREFASHAYSGWCGWHHSWHWRGDGRGAVLEIRNQARAEVEAMDAEIKRLKERKIATSMLVDLTVRILEQMDVEEVHGL